MREKKTWRFLLIKFPIWFRRDYAVVRMVPITRLLNSTFKRKRLLSMWGLHDVLPPLKNETCRGHKGSVTPGISKTAKDFVAIDLTRILWRFTISIKSSLCVMFRCWCTLLIINMIFKAFKEALSIIGLSFDCRNQSKWIEFDWVRLSSIFERSIYYARTQQDMFRTNRGCWMVHVTQT